MQNVLTRTALFLFVCYVGTGAVFAQIDPDPDGIGVYFDLEATQVVTTALADENVEAYLILTNPSEVGTVWMWEGGVAPYFGEPIMELAQVFGAPVNAINIFNNMPGDPRWHCLAFPDPGTPVPLDPITVLAVLDIWVMDDTEPVNLYAYGYYSPAQGAPFVDLNPSSGAPHLPVAVINGDAPTAIDEDGAAATWSRIKGTFR